MASTEAKEIGEGFENPMEKQAPSAASSDVPSLRFCVNQVNLDPSGDDTLNPSPRMTFPENTTPSRPLSTLDADATIGYATHDAVPLTVFYRNENSQSNATKKSRPTLQELRKGFEEDHEQQVWNLFPVLYYTASLVIIISHYWPEMVKNCSRYAHFYSKTVRELLAHISRAKIGGIKE